MVVPVVLRTARAAPDLDEPHAPLEKPPGQQTAAAEFGGHRIVQAIQRPGRGRLAVQLEGLGGRLLHPGGQLVGLDPGIEPGISRVDAA